MPLHRHPQRKRPRTQGLHSLAEASPPRSKKETLVAEQTVSRRAPIRTLRPLASGRIIAGRLVEQYVYPQSPADRAAHEAAFYVRRPVKVAA